MLRVFKSLQLKIETLSCSTWIVATVSLFCIIVWRILQDYSNHQTHLRQVFPYALFALFQINIKYLTQSRHLQPKKSFSLAAYKKHAVLTHVDFFRLIFYHFHMPLPQTAQSLKVSLHGLVHIKM